MSSLTTTQAETAKFKRSRAYADKLWAQWPSREQWPGTLNLYESAAYLRCSYEYLWEACQPDRKKKARLKHQRLGADYRVQRESLDRFGLVEERSAA